MKVLVLQLARFGDIYQTIPAINAYKRTHENDEVDLLVREKFSEAAKACDSVSHIIKLETKKVLASFFNVKLNDKNEDPFVSQLDEALTEIDNFLKILLEKKYDIIYNLSFSPLSSYIVSAISDKKTQVFGYTRFLDGYLSIPDDSSAFFYAQVGVHKKNRIHLCDIFANILGVDLEKEDFKINYDLIDQNKRNITEKLKSSYFILHVGASDSLKTLETFKWIQVIRKLKPISKYQIVLMGSKEEQSIAKEITDQINDDERVINLVGETTLSDIPFYIQKADLVVGADSLFMQMATLLNKASLNISFETVNFWETGPLADNSAVLWRNVPELLTSDAISQEILEYENKKQFSKEVIHRARVDEDLHTDNTHQTDKIVKYSKKESHEETFHWQLVKALYMNGAEFPMLLRNEHIVAMEKLNELLPVIFLQLEQLGQINKNLSTNERLQKIQDHQNILNECESVLVTIFKITPDLAPIYWWYETEKLRIGPNNFDAVLMQTRGVYEHLQAIVQLYLSMSEKQPTKINPSAEV